MMIKMTKVLVTKLHNLSLIPGIHKGEPMASSCPVTLLWLTHARIQIKYGINKNVTIQN